MTAKKKPTETTVETVAVPCGHCGTTTEPVTLVSTPGGANMTVTCPRCADEHFIPAGFVIVGDE